MHTLGKIGKKTLLPEENGIKHIALPLFLTQYHGESQVDGIEFTIDNGYEIEKETTPSEFIHCGNEEPFKYTPLGNGRIFLCTWE